VPPPPPPPLLLAPPKNSEKMPQTTAQFSLIPALNVEFFSLGVLDNFGVFLCNALIFVESGVNLRQHLVRAQANLRFFDRKKGSFDRK
jgi:hypothetical protein